MVDFEYFAASVFAFAMVSDYIFSFEACQVFVKYAGREFSFDEYTLARASRKVETVFHENGIPGRTFASRCDQAGHDGYGNRDAGAESFGRPRYT